MPSYSYRCPNHHEFEVFYKSFSSAEPFIDKATCDCGAEAVRTQEVTLQAHLYGDPNGYHKPSPTKRYNTKLVSRKTGNRSACG